MASFLDVDGVLFRSDIIGQRPRFSGLSEVILSSRASSYRLYWDILTLITLLLQRN